LHDGERAVLDVTARSVAMRRNGATHVLDAGATLDALLGQQRASTLVRPRPPADVARRIDALLPETTLRFWNSDRV
jgi:hypothetical protein